MLFVILGKQVKILYEPVAVRCVKTDRQPAVTGSDSVSLKSDSARSPQIGDKPLEFFPRRRSGFAPSRNIRVTKAFYYDRERRFEGEFILRRNQNANKAKDTIIQIAVTRRLFSAYCGNSTLYSRL